MSPQPIGTDTPTPQPLTPAPPPLIFILRLNVLIGSPLELGEVRGEARRIIPITGGNFAGPRLRGQILPGGADWQTTRSDRVALLEARYTLQTDSGDLITVVNRGFRHGKPTLAAQIAAGVRVPPSEYYFMTAPRFETSASELQWLTRAIFVGVASRHPEQVVIDVWQVGSDVNTL